METLLKRRLTCNDSHGQTQGDGDEESTHVKYSKPDCPTKQRINYTWCHTFCVRMCSIRWLHSYVVWSSQSLICKRRCASHPSRPGSPCVLRTVRVSWHWNASSMWIWKRKAYEELWCTDDLMKGYVSVWWSKPWDIGIRWLIQRQQWIRLSWLPMAAEPRIWKPQQQHRQQGCTTAYGSDRGVNIHTPLSIRPHWYEA